MESGSSQAPTAALAEAGAFWVFGYGSLMWRPGFDFLERQPALVRGFRRRLCVLSHFHRGSRERPGVVLGLDRGGACRGVAFRVCPSQRAATLAYLRAREQVTSVYLEKAVPASLADGRRVEAVTYIVDPSHEQYLRPQPRDTLLDLVRQGVGQSGANPDYILNTYRHLEELGVHDPVLHWLVARIVADR
jgi:cation transport protein ChaC